MNLSSLQPPPGQHRARKRVGRGMGSGHGKTATRGSKGQGSRSGSRRRRGFEGGQMPLQRRLPKRGFRNIFKKRYAVVNLQQIVALEEPAISPEILIARGVIKKLYDGLKILGEGDLSAPVSVSAHRFSRSAREKILQAGGKAEVIAAA